MEVRVALSAVIAASILCMLEDHGLTLLLGIYKNRVRRGFALSQCATVDNIVGYGEAAVKLQRDWRHDPQNLPLAKSIKGGALVRLIKYGLRYYYTDQTWDRVSIILINSGLELTTRAIACSEKNPITTFNALFWARIRTAWLTSRG